jgi:adenylate cyclase
MRKSILVVASDSDLRALLARKLMGLGHVVELAEIIAAARRAFTNGHRFALAIVAPNAIGPDANDLVEELGTTIGKGVVATSNGRERNSVDPGNMQDLLANVQGALQADDAPAPRAQPLLGFGDYTLNPNAQELRDAEGKEIALTRSEYALLVAFARHHSRVLTRDYLGEVLGGRGAASYERSIDMLIVRLRRKIEIDPKRPELILTVPGAGYKFAVKPVLRPIEQSATEGQALDVPATAPGNGDVQPEAPAQEARSRHRWLRWRGVPAAAAALLVLVAAGAGGFWYLNGPPSAQPEVAVAAPGEMSNLPVIAVLPFEDISGQTDSSYFTDGVTLDLIDALTRFPNIAVIASRSASTYRGTPADIRQIGADLGASYVLEGSTRLEGDRMRIVAQLIDARTGQNVWSERYDNTGTDPWTLRDEVVGAIVTALAGEGGEIHRTQYAAAWGKDTTSLGEYDYYLRGHEYFMILDRERRNRAAIIWNEGLSKYPDSALLRIKLAWFYHMAALLGWSETPEDDFRTAEELAFAVNREPRLPPAVRKVTHWLLAHIHARNRDYGAARTEMETAVLLAPYDTFMKADLGDVAIQSGDVSLAVQWAEEHSRLNPTGYSRASILVWGYNILGEHEKAVAALDSRVLRGQAGPLMGASSLVQLGREDEAREMLAQLLRREPYLTQSLVRDLYYIKDTAVLERQVQDLAKAGLPE